MADSGRHTRHTDRDGITVTSTGKVRSGVWLLVAALALVAVILVSVIGPSFSERPTVAAPQPDERVAASGAQSRAKAPSERRPRETGAGERPQLPAQEQRRAPDRDADDAIPAEGGTDGAEADSEGPSGIELFPPPGTDPVKPGIVVPDDFELPVGFVRHYQTTDNGKQLPPILMFHPDYQPVDANGEKIALPEDRVVPPDLAPPGLAHEMLDVPDDSVPMIEGPNDRPDAD